MTDLPQVLIIGDSISIGYTQRVADLLGGAASVIRNDGNARDSGNVLANLDAWLDGEGAAVIHFNCGLHDIKTDRHSRSRLASIEQYRANLSGIVERLKATGAELLWATSTPVIDRRHNAAKEFDRHNADVEAYNAAADEIIRAAGIHTDDLYGATVAHGPEMMLSDDGVHMTEGGYSVLAEAVAESILKVLPGK